MLHSGHLKLAMNTIWQYISVCEHNSAATDNRRSIYQWLGLCQTDLHPADKRNRIFGVSDFPRHNIDLRKITMFKFMHTTNMFGRCPYLVTLLE
jgi:hypothetical protein